MTRAKKIMMLGEWFSAKEAQELGASVSVQGFPSVFCVGGGPKVVAATP